MAVKQKQLEAKQDEFCRAVDYGDEDAVKTLLKWGVEPDRNEPNLNNKKPLWQAALKNHVGVLKLLLESGKSIDVNAKSNNHGETALHETAIYGWEEGARVLLDHGADVDLGKGGGWTPLHEAANFFAW